MKMAPFRFLFGDRAPGAKMACYRLKEAMKEFLASRPYWWSDSALLANHNAYTGKTCVIVGNGPSLNETNTSLLRDCLSFGMNRIYLAFDKLGFIPSFYVCVNQLVIEQCWDDIKKLPMLKFLSSHHGVWNRREMDAVFLRTKEGTSNKNCGAFFSSSPVDGLWEGATVTYVAMQLAYWMGFQKVILIGVDHNFVTKGEPHKAIVSEGDDPNHFAGNYFGKGFRWQLPDLETSEVAYHMADRAFRAVGREIVDCTVGGKCQVFRKGRLEDELGLGDRAGSV